jgi:glyoxylase-like metal-dependent hydrolase (beta-lactamase superfamily II)
MLSAVEGISAGAPITTVVNTHPDPDHWWGNAELPGAEVVAAQAAAVAMRHEATPERLAGLRRISQLTGRVPGRVGQAGRYVAGMLEPFALEDVTLRFPDRTFTGRSAETIGGRAVELIDLGAAHTASDSVVLVPDARVAYTGDLLFADVTPVMWHGPVTEWLRALDAIAALEADVFVPGHGPVSTRRRLRGLQDYWTWLHASVGEARQAGRSPTQTCRHLIATREFQAFAAWENPERLYINVATIDRQLTGKGPIPDHPLARAKAFDGVAHLCAHLDHHRITTHR